MAQSKIKPGRPRQRLVPSMVTADPEVLARESTAHAAAISRLENRASDDLIRAGTDLPEGVVVANPGTLYIRQSAAPSLWFKSSGTSNTGWSQIAIP